MKRLTLVMLVMFLVFFLSVFALAEEKEKVKTEQGKIEIKIDSNGEINLEEFKKTGIFASYEAKKYPEELKAVYNDPEKIIPVDLYGRIKPDGIFHYIIFATYEKAVLLDLNENIITVQKKKGIKTGERLFAWHIFLGMITILLAMVPNFLTKQHLKSRTDMHNMCLGGFGASLNILAIIFTLLTLMSLPSSLPVYTSKISFISFAIATLALLICFCIKASYFAESTETSEDSEDSEDIKAHKYISSFFYIFVFFGLIILYV